MATFAKSTFNSVQYAAARPTYPRQLFDFVHGYHERSPAARWDTALDLGCGTGQAAVNLDRFQNIIGVDPSLNMLEKARKEADEKFGAQASRIQFVQSAAENLSFVADTSVDLIVAAQAGHWFDWHKLWPEVARVLRPGGSCVFWGYSEFRVADYPGVTYLINEYSQGKDPKKNLGPYWEQPGRKILDNHLLDVPKAVDVVPNAFTDSEHVFFTGDHHPDLPNPKPVILRKPTTWHGVNAYLQTYSSLHRYHEVYPNDKNSPAGNLAQRFAARLRGATIGFGMDRDQLDVTIEWPMAVVMVRRAGGGSA